jgi:hypothetical protein
MTLDIACDQRLAFFKRPFVHSARRIMDVAVEKSTVIRIIHDLPDGGTRTFRNNAVNDALAFSHPSSGKAHIRRLQLQDTANKLLYIHLRYVKQKKPYLFKVLLSLTLCSNHKQSLAFKVHGF